VRERAREFVSHLSIDDSYQGIASAMPLRKVIPAAIEASPETSTLKNLNIPLRYR
jgi:hypothetical protein